MEVRDFADRPAEWVYEVVAGEEDERTCDAISDDACAEVPGNFLLNALNGVCTKLAEQLASPGLVLPWVLGAIGAPTALIGLLVPVRRAAALLPQLAVAGWIRAYPKRKWFWTGAGLVQAGALAAMVPALWLSPTQAGGAVVALLAVFAVASGVGSVAFKDVVAKTIPRGRRGRLLGVRATAGGLLALVAAAVLRFTVAEEESLGPYVALLVAAAALWVLAAGLFAGIREGGGASEGGRNAFEEGRAGLRFLGEQPGFRRFVFARALLLSAQFAVPFYALHAQAVTGVNASHLALFVMASSLAAVVSSPFWGKFSDAAAHRVMVAGGVWSALTIAAALTAELVPDEGARLIVLTFVFLSSGFAVAGVRLGRKTYLLDGAPEVERPLMVAVANTLVGVMYALGAGLGVLAAHLGIPVVLGVLGGLAVAGTAVAGSLPPAERLVVERGDASG